MQFVAGDVVRVKRAGPWMTVEKVWETTAACVWFDTESKLQRNSFLFVILEKWPE